ncbi:hypothetical protein SO802_010551 [Lithocarpus litseifolius]|uniref:Pentatricopeptide repeat-containing protein n=1 Tax=Lithocarpus litseifolius TaxID=425828 RepID=A0AAW2DFZ0_9ROSI
MMKRRFRPTAASYNPIIARLCKEGKVDLVLKCLDKMIYRHCSPNDRTYNAIAVLCEEGMVQEAFFIIQSLEGIAHENETELAAKVLKDLRVKQVVSQSTVERLVMQLYLWGLFLPSSARLWAQCRGGSECPTSKRASPTFNLISCEAKEVVYHRILVFEYRNTMVHYFLRFIAYKVESGGSSLRCGTL